MGRRGFLARLGGWLAALCGFSAAAAVPTPAAALPEKIPSIHCFEDFRAMVEAIRAFVARTGEPVFSNDDVMLRQIGFCTDGGEVRWFVPLHALKNFQETNPQFPREFFRSATGRARFAEWPSSGKPASDEHPYR